MKQFLTSEDKELQSKRADALSTLVARYVDMLDWEENLKKVELVRVADGIIKLVKKTKKMWIRGGFIDMYELGHDEEPPFAGPAGEPIPERELAITEKFATITRPKTRHLKVKK